MASSDRPTFRLPDPEAWTTLVRDLGLDDTQAHELALVLRHMAADIEAFNSRVRSAQDRFMAVDALKEIERAFTKLEAVLDKHDARLAEILPSDSLEALGRLMSHEAIEAALDIDLPTPGLTALIETSGNDSGSDLRAVDIDAHFSYVRQSFGLRRGPELLRHSLKQIADPMREWISANSENDGGRPGNAVREYVIIYLANTSETTIGRMASATANGPFSKLCSAVFAACGLPTSGIEPAIERALKKRASSPRMHWHFDDPGT